MRDTEGRSTGTGDVDEDLREEQAYLLHSRRCLAAMRAAVERLTPQGGDRIADEILEVAFARRLKALEDKPDLPLFFGRIDVEATEEAFHVGRRHVHDALLDPVVVDWRADVSRPFYQASRRDPHGLLRRRRFGFRGGSITAIEEELLGRGQQIEGLSPLVAQEIERPRTGPMRDIVATIQPEQDEIVRAALGETICVQGGPGTGKTAVGLHRVAYLLYAHPEQLSRSGVLVLGPNDAFIRYISEVLPALGEFDVEQKPLQELLAAVPVRRRDDPAAALKHDERMAEVIRRRIAANLRPVQEALTIRVNARALRLDPAHVERIRERVLRRGLPYHAGRTIFRERVVVELLHRAERTHGSVERADVAAALRLAAPARTVDAAWPRLEPVGLVHALLSNERVLAEAGDGVLTDAEQDGLRWDRTVSKARAPWSSADLVLIDEAAGSLERPRSFGYLVVDEAQDRSPMELRAIGRRSRVG